MGWVVNATPWTIYLRERPGTHCVRGWVGSRAGLGGCGKSRPPRDSIPRPSMPQRVAMPTAGYQDTIVCLKTYGLFAVPAKPSLSYKNDHNIEIWNLEDKRKPESTREGYMISTCTCSCPCHEGIWGNRGTPPLIPNTETRV
jgi:hypothetical protein